MGEKFIFDVPASVTAIDNILMIAEKIKDQDDFSGKLAKKLYELSFEINSESFVKNLNNTLETCRNYGGLNIERAWDGGGRFTEGNDVLRLHRLALYLVIYLREIFFRNNSRLDEGSAFYLLNEFVRNNKNEFIESSKWCLNLLDDLPTLIMQEEFHSEHAIALSKAIQSTNITKVEDFIHTRDETVKKIDDWNNDYQNKLNAVELLNQRLETYQTAFNFVGLYQGFSKLSEDKLQELKSLKIQYYILGGILLALPVVEMFYVFSNLDELDLSKVIFLVIPTITLLLILFWFFRIILSEIKSIKSQVMQLELRMTLCQFIQSYADSSKDLREKNPEGFDKFENLIFSSIVSSDDKIPSTFDGMEHLSNLLKNFKSNN